MIQTLLVAALALGVLVALPMRKGARTDTPQPLHDLEEAQARKRAALLATVDIENDRTIGKLSEPDFRSLKTEYEGHALRALQEVDALRDSSYVDDELELEIVAIRERLRCPNRDAARIPSELGEQCGA